MFAMDDLTAFQRDILYIIDGLDAPKGLAIKDELDEYYNQEINHGRLYPNLDTLADKGLVKKGQHDNRTNSYTLTQRAHREIEARHDWMATYTSSDE
jgi:PadR family transcriptional regulator, regulatory protein PadR